MKITARVETPKHLSSYAPAISRQWAMTPGQNLKNGVQWALTLRPSLPGITCPFFSYIQKI